MSSSRHTNHDKPKNDLNNPPGANSTPTAASRQQTTSTTSFGLSSFGFGSIFNLGTSTFTNQINHYTNIVTQNISSLNLNSDSSPKPPGDDNNDTNDDFNFDVFLNDISIIDNQNSTQLTYNTINTSSLAGFDRNEGHVPQQQHQTRSNNNLEQNSTPSFNATAHQQKLLKELNPYWPLVAPLPISWFDNVEIVLLANPIIKQMYPNSITSLHTNTNPINTSQSTQNRPQNQNQPTPKINHSSTISSTPQTSLDDFYSDNIRSNYAAPTQLFYDTLISTLILMFGNPKLIYTHGSIDQQLSRGLSERIFISRSEFRTKVKDELGLMWNHQLYSYVDVFLRCAGQYRDGEVPTNKNAEYSTGIIGGGFGFGFGHMSNQNNKNNDQNGINQQKLNLTQFGTPSTEQFNNNYQQYQNNQLIKQQKQQKQQKDQQKQQNVSNSIHNVDSDGQIIVYPNGEIGHCLPIQRSTEPTGHNPNNNTTKNPNPHNPNTQTYDNISDQHLTDQQNSDKQSCFNKFNNFGGYFTNNGDMLMHNDCTSSNGSNSPLDTHVVGMDENHLGVGLVLSASKPHQMNANGQQVGSGYKIDQLGELSVNQDQNKNGNNNQNGNDNMCDDDDDINHDNYQRLELFVSSNQLMRTNNNHNNRNDNNNNNSNFDNNNQQATPANSNDPRVSSASLDSP
jgi:hypothetical protein